MDTGTLNTHWSLALIDGLARSGVDRFVVSPGSRSTPLALAIDRHPAVKAWVVLDERAAAFFALGLAKADGRPVGVLATSGSAPAHWHPAVIEADLGKIPLVLLSADRPPEHLDCGANQTADQIKLFGTAVRAFHALPPPDETSLDHLAALAARLTDRARWPLPGPVHINAPFREPLLPQAPVPAIGRHGPAHAHYPLAHPDPDTIAHLAERMSGRSGAIVCGWDRYPPDFAEAVTRLAEASAAPILADPLSDLRCGPHDRSRILARYDAFLGRRRFRAQPQWVLRFGALPVSKNLMLWLDGLSPERHMVVEAHGRWPDPLHRTSDVIHADPALLARALAEAVAPAPEEWLAAFATEEARIAALAAPRPVEAAVITALREALPPGAILLAGNSLPVRDLDSFLEASPRRLRIEGNRGASGIDGTIATAAGLAAAMDGAVPVAALLGDLAFVHDMGALATLGGLDVTLVVLDNGGGAIFEQLSQARLDRPTFERYWLTPSGVDIGDLARAHKIAHRRLDDPATFRPALAEAVSQGGPHVVEISIDRAASHNARQAYGRAAAAD